MPSFSNFSTFMATGYSQQHQMSSVECTIHPSIFQYYLVSNVDYCPYSTAFQCFCLDPSNFVAFNVRFGRHPTLDHDLVYSCLDAA